MEQDDDTSRIDDLPSEIWVHIFDFLEWNEVCKASTSISLKLSQSLLVDDPQELIYRHLCLQSMKKDMKQAIDNILNRELRFSRRLLYHKEASKKRSFASPLPSHSMKELRNRLEYQSKLLFNYFPEFYNEYSESIKHALNYSHSANVPFSLGDVVEEYSEGYGDGMEEHEDYREVIMIRPKVKTEHSFQFKKKNKIPKWKSIWNGYSKESAKHKVLDLIDSIPFWISYHRRHREKTTDIPFDYTLLKNLLISLSPQLRHSILFKTNYSQFKQPIKFKHCSSDLIGYLIYDLKRRTTIDYDAFFDILDYLIEESRIFYGDYKSLTKDIIPHSSAIVYLFRYCRSFDHLKTFLTKYAKIIRYQSQANRFSLLVEFFKSSVDLRLINQMIRLGIIDIDTVTQWMKSRNARLVTIAYYIACNAFVIGHRSTEYYNYLIEFTNLIIGICNSDSPNPNYSPKETKEPEIQVVNAWDCTVVYESGFVEPEFTPTDHLLKLRKFGHVSLFKRMVKEAFNELPFPQRKPSNEDYYYDRFAENHMLKAFFRQYYKYCNDPPQRNHKHCKNAEHDKNAVQYEDDIPLDEYVGFERYKFGKLRNLRRRK